jgi:pre-mRNA-splicing factor ATP-dependent RNA helicase DHX15/PRP43
MYMHASLQVFLILIQIFFFFPNFFFFVNDLFAVPRVGHLMSEFPLDPQLTKVLITSPLFDCSNEALTIVAMLSSQPPFVRPKDTAREADKAKAQFNHMDGDHLTMLNVFNAYKQNSGPRSGAWCYDNYLNARALKSADNVRGQLARVMQRQNIPLRSADIGSKTYYVNIRKALTAGFFMQIAHLERTGHYLTVKDNQAVAIHPSCNLTSKPEWVLFNEFVLTNKHYIRTCIAVDGDWLVELAPHYFDLSNFPVNDTRRALEGLYARKRK